MASEGAVMSAAQHAETPWTREGVTLGDSEGREIGRFEDPADAEHAAMCVNAHDAMFEAIMTCLRAEKERRAKLKAGSPASTYTEARIAKIEAAIALTEPTFDDDPDNDQNPDHRDREDDEQGFAL